MRRPAHGVRHEPPRRIRRSPAMSESDHPYTFSGDGGDTLDSQDDIGPLSQFRHGAQDRRLLELARLDAGLAANNDFDDKPWGLLYRALTDSIEVSPDDFQL